MWQCKNCGAEVEDDSWRVCWKCSTKRDVRPEEAEIVESDPVAETVRQPAESRKPWRTTYAVLLVILAALLTWYYHVPTPSYLPINSSWQTLRKDWAGVLFSHLKYYRYRAREPVQTVTAHRRPRLCAQQVVSRGRDV